MLPEGIAFFAYLKIKVGGAHQEKGFEYNRSTIP